MPTKKDETLYSCGKPLPIMYSIKDAKDGIAERKRAMKKRKANKFTDLEFKPGLESLFLDPEQPSGVIPCHTEIKWLRVSEMPENTKDWPGKARRTAPRLFQGGTEPGDVNQGYLGNCWFVSAISIVAVPTKEQQRKEKKMPAHKKSVASMVRYLFCLDDDIISEEDSLKYGMYCIRIFKEDAWKYVIIDDFLPNMPNQGPFFTHSSHPDEFWVALLEKAYAKMHGCYEALTAGEVHYGLRDLSGGVPIEINIHAMVKSKKKDSMWEDIKRYDDEEAFMGAGSGGNDDSQQSNTGIVQGHAYAILDKYESRDGKIRLLKMRNPHGEGGAEWKGPWSDQEWKRNDGGYQHGSMWKKYPEVEKDIKGDYDPDESGVFYMSFDDFCSEFKSLWVVRHLADDDDIETEPSSSPYKELRQEGNTTGWTSGEVLHLGGKNGGRWNEKNAAGWPPANKKGWHLNPQYYFGVNIKKKSDAEVLIIMAQKDAKIQRGADFNKFNTVGFAILKLNGPEPIKEPNVKKYIHAMSTMSIDREVSVNMVLKSGHYAIMPWSKDKGLITDFSLKIYFKKGETTISQNPKKPAVFGKDDPLIDISDEVYIEKRHYQDSDSDDDNDDDDGDYSTDESAGVQSMAGVMLADKGDGSNAAAGGAMTASGMEDIKNDMKQMMTTIKMMQMKITNLEHALKDTNQSVQITSQNALSQSTPRGRFGAPSSHHQDDVRSVGSTSPKRMPQSRVKAKYTYDPQDIYIKTCKQYSIKPNSLVNLDPEDDHIELANNYLGENGAVPLIAALKHYPRIASVNLSDIALEDENCEALVDVLAAHPELTELNLSKNNLEADAGAAILSLVKSNKALVKIDISGTKIDRATMQAITTQVRRNQQHWDDSLKELARQFMETNDPSLLLSAIRSE